MIQDISYPSADGIHQIQGRLWLPEGRPQGVIQIVHGVAEHVDRYGHLAQFLNAHGFAVCGEDHLGHGRTASDGKYGYFAEKGGWDLVVRDVRRLRELMGERFPGLPYVMLGHSMGSFLTRTYLIQYPGTVDAAVLSGTGQEHPAAVGAGKLAASIIGAIRGQDHVSQLVQQLSLGAYNKRFAPNRTTADWISRDEAVVDAYLKDPLCTFQPTVSMFRDMMGGLQSIARPKELARMDKDTPVYFLSGSQDPVGSMGAGVKKVAEMFRAAGCRDVTVKLYPGGRHEMFNEIGRQEVMDDLLAWLEQKL